MKKILFTGLLILALFILTPIILLSENKKETNTTSPETNITPSPAIIETTVTENDFSKEEAEYIATFATNLLKYEDTKALKEAVLVLSVNNYKYQLQNEEPLTELRVNSFSDELFSELQSMLRDTVTELHYGNEKVYIPIISYGSINTVTDEDYPYLVSVATPWESENINFNRFYGDTCGVSVSSMRYLSEKGLSTEEILAWHLPEFQIINHKTHKN